MKVNNFATAVALLQEKGWTLGSCESCTGGLFASKITEIPGVSSVFKGAVVTYWTQIKIDVVGVDEKVIQQYGVISEQTAYEMANHCAELLNCDVCVSFTGNAGPAVMEDKPAGTVMMAIRFPDQTKTFTQHFLKDRQGVRNSAVEWLCETLVNQLKNKRKFVDLNE